jgi:hypothetical protein
MLPNQVLRCDGGPYPTASTSDVAPGAPVWLSTSNRDGGFRGDMAVGPKLARWICDWKV